VVKVSKISTGLQKLDKLLGGGFPEKTVILLSGGPGTGKTLFGINFLLEGARKGERCCYVSLSETREEIVRACKGIERMKDVEKFLGKNLAVEYIGLSDSDVNLKMFVSLMREYPKIDRIVIDNANKLLMFADSRRSYRINFSQIIECLKNTGCGLIICETDGESMDGGNGEAYECDGVVQLSFLELEEKPMRSLTIHKLRYSSFDAKVPHELILDNSGIRLGETKVI
jgi:circadian clock protein KaiC